MACGLAELRVEVHLFARSRSQVPKNGFLHYIPEFPLEFFVVGERVPWHFYEDKLKEMDVIHSFQHSGYVHNSIHYYGKRNSLHTCWGTLLPAHVFKRNIVAWSEFHRQCMIQQGAPESTRYVYGGTNTDFYCPSNYEKDDFLLFLSRWHPCMPKGNVVILYDSIKDVSEVKVGDVVISHEGTPNKVTFISKHPFNGDLVEITPYKISIPILITPEHVIPILRDTNPVKEQMSPKYRIYRLYRQRHKEDFKVIWIPANQIRKDDFLLVPKNPKSADKTRIVIKDFGGYKPIPNPIKITPEFLRFCGYYVAEGCGSRGIELVFNQDSEKLVQDACKCGETTFGFKPKIRIRGNRAIIDFYSIALERLFKSWFGLRAKEKHLPSWLFKLPKGKLRHFLKGIWRGDGSTFKSYNVRVFSYGTTSKTLAWQLWFLLLKCGVVAGIYIRNVKEGFIDGRRVKSTVCYDLNILGRSAETFGELTDWKAPRTKYVHECFFKFQEFIALPIRNIRNVPFNGIVYNLEVENSGTYLCNGIAVHNSKRPEVVLALAKRFPDVNFVFGSKPGTPDHVYYGAKYLEVANKFRNVKHIEPTHEEKRELYRRARAVIFPSVGEAFGLVLVEALSCGCPVIATRDGAFVELVREGETGFLASSLDEFARAIKNVDALEPKRCREDAVKRWDRSRAAADYLKIYEEIADGYTF